MESTLTLPDVPRESRSDSAERPDLAVGVVGQFWTVKWIGGGDKGKDVVVAPTQQEAIAKWIRDKGDGQRYFLNIERTRVANG